MKLKKLFVISIMFQFFTRGLGFLELEAQNILWSREWLRDTIGRSVNALIAPNSTNKLFSIIERTDLEIYLIPAIRQENSTLVSLYRTNGNTKDSLMLSSKTFFYNLVSSTNKLVVNKFSDGILYLCYYSYDLVEEDCKPMPKDYMPVNINITDTTINVMGYRSYSNYVEYCNYFYDFHLNVTDSLKILSTQIAAYDPYYSFSPAISKLCYSPYTHLYFFNERYNQVIIDANTGQVIDVKLYLSNLNPPINPITAIYRCVSSSDLIQLENGKVIAVGSTRYYSNVFQSTVRVVKYDEEFHVEDTLEYSDIPDKSKQILSVHQAISWIGNPNEIYIVSTKGYREWGALVSKIDTSLNLYWYKNFIHPSKKYMPYGIEALEDGGAIVYGTALDSDSVNNSGYIIRIDSSGAITSTSDPLMQIEKDYVMYPNPAKDYVWFQAQKPYQTISIRIYDIHGKLVYQKEDVQEEQINISEWSKGMYLYQIECEGRISSGKILKE